MCGTRVITVGSRHLAQLERGAGAVESHDCAVGASAVCGRLYAVPARIDDRARRVTPDAKRARRREGKPSRRARADRGLEGRGRQPRMTFAPTATPYMCGPPRQECDASGACRARDEVSGARAARLARAADATYRAVRSHIHLETLDTVGPIVIMVILVSEPGLLISSAIARLDARMRIADVPLFHWLGPAHREQAGE
jgi:hypothetical protein